MPKKKRATTTFLQSKLRHYQVSAIVRRKSTTKMRHASVTRLSTNGHTYVSKQVSRGLDSSSGAVPKEMMR